MLKFARPLTKAINRTTQPAAARLFSSVSSQRNADKPSILVTGAVGQIGTELVVKLRERYGADNVVATDIKMPPRDSKLKQSGPFAYLDVMNYDNIARLVLEHQCDTIVHLAAILSAYGIENVLELAKNNNLRVFSPSTIAVFGPSTPRDNTPDSTIMRPTTMYGLTKVYLELLGEYYHKKYGVDFRSVRYPGIISNQAMPGGGTTDYAVEIYHEALKTGKYCCFLKKDTAMPMMYADDCIDAVIQLMEAPAASLTQRTYNVTGLSFTPEQLADSIKKEIPDFKIEYKPDFRQAIADSWPRSLDDSIARKDWGWNPKIATPDAMTKIMFEGLRDRYRKK